LELHTARNSRNERGFTFIELAISISVLAMIMGVVAMFQLRAQKAANAIQTTADVERRADRAMTAITKELSGVGVSTLQPDPLTNLGSDTIQFQTPQSVSAAGVVSWNNATRIELAMDDGEIDNGIDDDGDGLIDERRILVTHDVGTPSQKMVVICHGVAKWLEGESGNNLDDNGNGIVDEHGFSVQRIGDLLQVRLTVQGVGEAHGVIAWTATGALVVHN
jgi:prepilin-type N-terminal cleavage/methylation domain-containing protein